MKRKVTTACRCGLAVEMVSWAGMVTVVVVALFGLGLPAGAEPGSTAATPAGSDLMPLKLELPDLVFEGTPLDYWSPHLEMYKKRPEFMVPKGTVNLAKGKPVTGSDKKPAIGKLAMIADGNKEATDDSLVELASGLQYVQIDLEKPHPLYAILVWHFHAEERVYHDFIVQVSAAPKFKEKVTTLYNNDFDNSARLGVGKDKEYIEDNRGRLVDAKGVTARYVRLYTNRNSSNDLNHYLEVEVYGKPPA